tara:strand:+ start:448 stop:579 length:132 start_codon:yes stop_codon:yes gene_type:complete
MEEKYVSTFLIASIIGGVIGGAIGLIIPAPIYMLPNFFNKHTN